MAFWSLCVSGFHGAGLLEKIGVVRRVFFIAVAMRLEELIKCVENSILKRAVCINSSFKMTKSSSTSSVNDIPMQQRRLEEQKTDCLYTNASNFQIGSACVQSLLNHHQTLTGLISRAYPKD
jgi:hypothetical protein